MLIYRVELFTSEVAFVKQPQVTSTVGTGNPGEEQIPERPQIVGSRGGS